MCAGLWCFVEGDTSCKTKLDPPLDGTECGADKVIKILSSNEFVFSSIVSGVMFPRFSIYHESTFYTNSVTKIAQLTAGLGQILLILLSVFQ